MLRVVLMLLVVHSTDRAQALTLVAARLDNRVIPASIVNARSDHRNAEECPKGHSIFYIIKKHFYVNTHQQFDCTAIVIVEIINEEKAPETKYITIGSVGKISEDELKKDVLSYLNEIDALKEVKSVIYSNSEKYREYLEKALNDDANQ